MARWEGFEQCPGCGFDLVTGDGRRSCAWGDCPYLPDELKVLCDTCRFNLMTMQGNPSCDDPLSCEDAADARAHVENLRVWVEQRGGVSS
jgi:hypothetical protein